MNQNHLMVDIETMAVTPDASVVSIGACMFDPYAGLDQQITETFLVRTSLQSNEELGRAISGDTVMWWLGQAPEAQQNLLIDVTGLSYGLASFTKWFQHETTCRPDSVWANDPDFDIVILASAYRSCSQNWPLGFWANRSVRTVGALAYPHHDERKAVMKAFREHVGTHHRADHDAVAQALFVIHCMEELNAHDRLPERYD